MFFEGVNLKDFWGEDSVLYKRKEYPTDEEIKAIETQTGYKFPASYLWLMRQHNGGAVVYNSWFFDEVLSVQDVLAEYESLVKDDTWSYPDIGVPICHCPSDVHDAYFLDYRDCGADGEPAVAHVDQEGADGFEIDRVAENFEEFIKQARFGERVFEREYVKSKLLDVMWNVAKVLMVICGIGGCLIGVTLVKEARDVPMVLVLGMVGAAIPAVICGVIDDKITKKLQAKQDRENIKHHKSEG